MDAETPDDPVEHYMGRATITPARYSGSYEGARWLAFPCHPSEMPDGWDGDDVTAATWWRNPLMTVGRGDTPNKALTDLTRKIMEEM